MIFTAQDLTLDRIRERDFLLLDTIAGSQAYGTSTPDSDEDRRGLFTVPDAFHAGLESIDQVADTKNDLIYYELRRFFQLLLKNNPTILELLYAPEDCIRYRHPVLDLIEPDLFLSKLCEKTFSGYAAMQIKKARGLNKKIVNPEPEERHHLRHFCHILEDQGSVQLADWLQAHGLEENDCGLVSVNHAPNTYALFHDPSVNYRGLFPRKDDAAILCSSVPREAKPIAWLHCNIDGFRTHCRRHREYWQWVSERNEARYQTNTEHGRGYDSKNMMHTLRLLEMASEIATEGTLKVRRPNADWLLRVRAGEFSYEELLTLSEEKLHLIEIAFQKSDLPEKPDRQKTAQLLREIQLQFADQNSSMV